jgi:DNA transformation protein
MSRAPTPFVEMCVELLGDAIGRVSAKGMFSGWGFFRDGRMFGLVVDDRLYLKTDATNRPAFEAEGLEPFTYLAKSKKRVSLGYYEVPPAALDDAAELRPWAIGAAEAAMRGPTAKKTRPAGTAEAARKPPKSQKKSAASKR